MLKQIACACCEVYEDTSTSHTLFDDVFDVENGRETGRGWNDCK